MYGFDWYISPETDIQKDKIRQAVWKKHMSLLALDLYSDALDQKPPFSMTKISAIAKEWK